MSPEVKEADPRARSMRYPKVGLKRVESFAREVFQQGARNCDLERIAKSQGFSTITSGSFRTLKAAVTYFGLANFDGVKFVSVDGGWIQAFHSEDSQLLVCARQNALRKPELYNMLLEEYLDRQLPSAEKLARELYLSPKYGILKDAADSAAKNFLESASFANLVDERGFLRAVVGSSSMELHPHQEVSSSEGEQQKYNHPSESSIAVPPTPDQLVHMRSNEDVLDRIEVRLRGNRKAYLLVPGALTQEDKNRMKGHIDLILEPEEETL